MTTPPSAPRIAPLPAEGERPPLNIFRTLERAPALSAAFLALGTHLLGGGVLPERERELVVLRVGWRAQSEYEFGQHTTIGAAAGLTPAEIARLADADADADAGDGSWSADDAALVAMVDELCDDEVVSDATWAALSDRWSEEQLLDLLVLAGYYRLVSGMLNSAGVALEAAAPGWPDGAAPRLRAPRADAS